MLPGKPLFDEKVFFVVTHGITKVNVLDSPAVAFKLVDDNPTKVLLVDGIVAGKSCGIVVEVEI